MFIVSEPFVEYLFQIVSIIYSVLNNASAIKYNTVMFRC